jgi:NADH-quinone oxidoreductase subunit I
VKAAPRRKYWNEPSLGTWERLYLFEVLRGLAITGKVFFGNMWKWVTGRKGALTAYYPEEIRADYSPNNRGRHVLTQRPNGEVQCVACNMCATVCPAYCIEIVAAADLTDPAHPKSPERFEIDYSRCIFCGFCVEACPEDAIRMVKDVPNLPGFDRDAMWGRKDLLKDWHPLTDPRKPYPASSSTDAEPPR